MATATKTPVKDPFAQADGAENNGKEQVKDPFGQAATGGNFPKPNDLWGYLIMLTPKKIEEVPDKFNKGQTVNRLSADLLVVDGIPADELAEHGIAMPSDDEDGTKWVGKSYKAMYWSQSPIVKAADAAMDEGTPAIMGRLWRFPISDDKEKYEDRYALEQALANWRPGQPQIRYAWSLERYTEEDAAKARALLAKRNGKAS